MEPTPNANGRTKQWRKPPKCADNELPSEPCARRRWAFPPESNVARFMMRPIKRPCRVNWSAAKPIRKAKTLPLMRLLMDRAKRMIFTPKFLPVTRLMIVGCVWTQRCITTPNTTTLFGTVSKWCMAMAMDKYLSASPFHLMSSDTNSRTA